MSAAPPPLNGTHVNGAQVNGNGFHPMSAQELQTAAESRAKKRAEFARLVEEAGMNPAELDITKIMSDEEQAVAIERMAHERRARDLAKQGRAALRERLKKTVEVHSAVCERATGRFDKPRDPTGSP